ncbi:hypothetical protein ABEU20_000410 [Rhodococcus sp. PAM 2766]|uniref:Endonuclease n=1 Tax=Rhodococcus parequi TaxID=3137122 RepID=A0ABW9F9L5_9NOCA
MTAQQIRALARHIDTALPGDRSRLPSGWPHEAEAALLDAIFSARATYGTPTSGVRRVVANWRAHRASDLDDLTALEAFTDAPDHLAEILDNRQRVPGNYTTKAEAAALAAAALADVGIAGSGQLGDGRTAQEALYSVPGLGGATWETFVLQLGLIGPAALDTMRGFVAEALGPAESPVTEAHALHLLAAAAETENIPPAALLNAAWRHGRTRAIAPKPLSA